MACWYGYCWGSMHLCAATDVALTCADKGSTADACTGTTGTTALVARLACAENHTCSPWLQAIEQHPMAPVDREWVTNFLCHHIYIYAGACRLWSCASVELLVAAGQHQWGQRLRHVCCGRCREQHSWQQNNRSGINSRRYMPAAAVCLHAESTRVHRVPHKLLHAFEIRAARRVCLLKSVCVVNLSHWLHMMPSACLCVCRAGWG